MIESLVAKKLLDINRTNLKGFGKNYSWM